MHSELKIAASTVSWLNSNLPFPRPDVYGRCNFFEGVGFMEEGISKCNHIVTDLENTCTTILNPRYFAEYLQVFAGRGSVSNRIQVQLGNLYKLKVGTDNTVSYVDGGAIADSVFTPGNSEADCSCSGAIKEVGYKVYITAKEP